MNMLFIERLFTDASMTRRCTVLEINNVSITTNRLVHWSELWSQKFCDVAKNFTSKFS